MPMSPDVSSPVRVIKGTACTSTLPMLILPWNSALNDMCQATLGLMLYCTSCWSQAANV